MNEIEKMTKRLCDAYERDNDDWRSVACIALISHPAVEALREWEQFASKTIEGLEQDDPLRSRIEKLHGPRLERTRRVLENLTERQQPSGSNRCLVIPRDEVHPLQVDDDDTQPSSTPTAPVVDVRRLLIDYHIHDGIYVRPPMIEAMTRALAAQGVRTKDGAP